MYGLVVTDMDNTLYSWTFYIVPAVEAMVEAVCRATAFPRIKVIQSVKAVYEKYLPEEGGHVLDPCAGYGGRLLGAVCTERVLSYTGLEPAEETLANSRRMDQ